MRPKRSDNKYWTGTRNFNHLQYESDLEDYISDLEVENEQLHKLGVMRPASASGKGRTVASEGQGEANTCAGHDYAFHHTAQVFYCVHCGVKRYVDCG